MPGRLERRGSRAHQDPKASQAPQVQWVPKESEDPKGNPVRRATRVFKASQVFQARRVLLDSQAKLEHLAHLDPRQRRAAKGFEAQQACLVPLGHRDLLGFKALQGWTAWTGRMASLACGETLVLLAPLDSWDLRVSRGKQDIPAFQDPRVTVANQALLAAMVGQVQRVNLVLWDPRDDRAPPAMLDRQGLQASLVQLGSLQWA